jgi:hypothetical protein
VTPASPGYWNNNVFSNLAAKAADNLLATFARIFTRKSLEEEILGQQEMKHMDKLPLAIFEKLKLSFIHCKLKTNGTSQTRLHCIHIHVKIRMLMC